MSGEVERQGEAVIEPIRRCWEVASKPMPPVDLENLKDDPQTALDTLAAAAHAKWSKVESLEAQLAQVETCLGVFDATQQDHESGVTAEETIEAIRAALHQGETE